MDLKNLEQYKLEKVPKTLDGKQSLRDYLLEIGAGKGDVVRVFDEEGRFNQIPGFEGWWELEPGKLADHLLVLFNGHYELQQVVLNKLMPTGFNDHGPTHIGRVTKQTLRILEQAGCNKDTQRVGAIASVCHDWGNMID